jgi:hypothetical protein
LQDELWSRVVQAAVAQSSPVLALAVSGMNDVLNPQGSRIYTGRVVEPHPGCGMDTDGEAEDRRNSVPKSKLRQALSIEIKSRRRLT